MNWLLSVRLQLGEFLLDVKIDQKVSPLILIGSNGSGKSTLIRTLAGAHHPQEGSIRLGNEIWFDSKRNIFTPPEHRNLGYVPQKYTLFPHLDVLDNISFGRIRSLNRKNRRAEALKILNEMSYPQLALRFPRDLSGGERQRVALARTFVLQPSLWLFDEPFSAIDPASRASVRSMLIKRLNASSSPVVMVTHSLEDIKAMNAQIAVMDSGSIVQLGSLEEITRDPQNPFASKIAKIKNEISNNN